MTRRELADLLDVPYTSMRHWASTKDFPPPSKGLSHWNLNHARLWLMANGTARVRVRSAAIPTTDCPPIPFLWLILACCDFDGMIEYRTDLLRLLRSCAPARRPVLDHELAIVRQALERVVLPGYADTGRTLHRLDEGIWGGERYDQHDRHWVFVSQVNHDLTIASVDAFFRSLHSGSLVINGSGRDSDVIIPPEWSEMPITTSNGEVLVWVSPATVDEIEELAHDLSHQ